MEFYNVIKASSLVLFLQLVHGHVGFSQEPVSRFIQQIDSLNEISEKYEYEDHHLAEAAAIKALNLSLNHNSYYGIGYSLSSLSNVYLQMGRYNEAEALLIQCLSVDSVLNKPANFVVDYANLANIMARSGNYQKSIDYSYLALEIAGKNNLDLYAAAIYNNVASRYNDIENPRKALEVCEKAIAIWNQYPDQEYNLGTAYLNLSQLFTDYPEIIPEEEPDIVMQLLDKAELNFEICMDPYKLHDVMLHKASLDIIEGDQSTALKLALEAENYFKSTENHLLLGDARIIAARALSNLNRFSEALLFVESAYTLSDSLGIWDIKQRSLFTKAEVLQKMGRYKESNLVLKESYSLRDSIMSKDLKISLLDLEAKYELSQLETQNLELENKTLSFSREQAKLQTLILIISLIFLLVLFIVLWILRNRRIQNKLEKINHQNVLTKERHQISELNLKVLGSQMNPHFTKNALTTLQDLIKSNEIEKSNRYLETFARLQRTILNNTSSNSISLENEIRLIKDYVVIEQLRWEEPFSFELIVDESLDLEYDRIPIMMLQPLVENAISHGLFHIKSEGHLSILLSKMESYGDEVFKCEIEDNGVGINFTEKLKPSTDKKRSTEIIRERLSILNDVTNSKCTLKIVEILNQSRQAVGTKVSIDLPFL